MQPPRTGMSPAPGLHVLMTTDAVGGVWTYALDLVQGLAAVGVSTTLAVLGPPPSANQRRRAERAGTNLVAIGAPLDWTATDVEDLRRAAGLVAEVAADIRPDVVHLNSPTLAAYAAFDVPVLGVCHSCPSTWWDTVKGGEPPEDFAWRIDATAAGYLACSALVAPSLSFARETARLYTIPAPVVVRNGRRSEPFARGPKDAALVLTAGRLWDEGKDVTILDRVAARLDVPFVALGPTRAPDGTDMRLDAMRARGALDAGEVARWLAKTSVFVSAAVYEPFGLAVLEAAKAEAALVLADTPTFRELWDGAALFVPAGDVIGFTDAIRGLLGAPERLRTWSLAASRRARRYTVAAMVDGYVGLYNRLAAPIGALDAVVEVPIA